MRIQKQQVIHCRTRITQIWVKSGITLNSNLGCTSGNITWWFDQLISLRIALRKFKGTKLFLKSFESSQNNNDWKGEELGKEGNLERNKISIWRYDSFNSKISSRDLRSSWQLLFNIRVCENKTEIQGWLEKGCYNITLWCRLGPKVLHIYNWKVGVNKKFCISLTNLT